MLRLNHPALLLFLAMVVTTARLPNSPVLLPPNSQALLFLATVVTTARRPNSPALLLFLAMVVTTAHRPNSPALLLFWAMVVTTARRNRNHKHHHLPPHQLHNQVGSLLRPTRVPRPLRLRRELNRLDNNRLDNRLEVDLGFQRQDQLVHNRVEVGRQELTRELNPLELAWLPRDRLAQANPPELVSCHLELV
jgi:hypothetical protein